MKVEISDYAWLPLEGYPSSKLSRLKDLLTVLPRRTHEKQADPDPIELFREVGARIGIPRTFYLDRKRLETDLTLTTSEGDEIAAEFNGVLKPDQAAASNVIVDSWKGGDLGGIVQATPGWGKTVVGLHILATMQRRTIIVVHKEFLLNQWLMRIKGDGKGHDGFLPDARVGIIQGERCEFGKDYDISIAMIQSLVSRFDSYPEELWNTFGLAIADEVHRVAAPTWAKVFPRFKAHYRLGLSATPYRRDGAQNVFFYHIGNVCYRSQTSRIVPRLRRIITGFELRRTPTFDPDRVDKAILLRFLCKNPARNKLIINELKKAVKAKRKIAVLSERRKHLVLLDEMFAKIKPEGCFSDFYVGSRTQGELDQAEEADVLWCTYQMVKEGLDIPNLDTIFLVTPISDVKQAVGRVMRECDEKKDPIVSDFIDTKVKRFAKLWNDRRRFYIKEGMFKEKKKEALK